MRHVILTVLVLALTSSAYAQTTPAPAPTDSTSVSTEELIRIRAQQIELRRREAELLRELAKRDNPDMRQARRELQSEENARKKREEEERRVLRDAAVSGCSADQVAEMKIEPHAVGSRALTSYVKVRVMNPHNFSVNIEDESGEVVTGLCAGGSITLFRARNMWNDGNFVMFQYTARGTFPDGSFGMATSQSYQLSAYDISSGRQSQNFNWMVQLNKIIPQN